MSSLSKKKYPHNELFLVPEAVLKKAHDLEELSRKHAAHLEAYPPKKQQKRTYGGIQQKKKAVYVVKPETILAQARSRRNQEIRYRRVQKKGMQKGASTQKQFQMKEVEVVDSTSTTVTNTTDSTTHMVKYQSNSVGALMVFCVRIRDDTAIPRQIRQALCRMGLSDIHQGVFLPYDTIHQQQNLHTLDPWIVYGPPTEAAVKDLLERRGFAKVGPKKKQRVPLSDNNVIEEALGVSHNLLCIDDLVHTLTNPKKDVAAYKAVAVDFLWPFRLADSKTDFERRTLKLKDGKEYGDIGERIQDYIQQVV